MLAEAGHAAADSLNEVLLGISLRRFELPDDRAHPLGHGRERFLWAFLAAVVSFVIGGCLSIGLAIRELITAEPLGDPLVAALVLAVAFAADSTSLVQTLRQARREASERGLSLPRYVVRASDPTLRAIMVEDSAALVGDVMAAAGLLLSFLLGSHIPDAVAALWIGVLLALTAVGLALPLADFLVGRSLPPDRLHRLYAVLSASPAVAEVLSFEAIYIGPDEANVWAKIRPVETLTLDQLTHAMQAVSAALRSTVPQVADVYLDVTGDVPRPLPLAATSASGHG